MNELTTSKAHKYAFVNAFVKTVAAIQIMSLDAAQLFYEFFFFLLSGFHRVMKLHGKLCSSSSVHGSPLGAGHTVCIEVVVVSMDDH